VEASFRRDGLGEWEYPRELPERAVRLVIEHRGDCGTGESVISRLGSLPLVVSLLRRLRIE